MWQQVASRCILQQPKRTSTTVIILVFCFFVSTFAFVIYSRFLPSSLWPNKKNLFACLHSDLCPVEVNEVSQHSTKAYGSSDYSCWSDAPPHTHTPFPSFSVDNNLSNPSSPVAPFSLMNTFSLAELIWRRVQPPLLCLSLTIAS